MTRMMTHRPGSPTLLYCLAMAVLAVGVSGCCTLSPKSSQCQDKDTGKDEGPRDAPKEEVLASGACTGADCDFQTSAMALRDPCPTGQCDPDDNGRGIYKVEGSFHCFLGGGQSRFCPEAFVNSPPNGFDPVPFVTLRGRDLLRADTFVYARLDNVRIETPGAPAQDARVLRFQAERTRLSVTTCPRSANCQDASNHTVHTGEALGRLTFQASAQGPLDRPGLGLTYRLKLTPQGTEDATGVQKYDVRYAEVDGSPQPRWVNHCDTRGVLGEGRAAGAFLPGWDVHGTTAAVTSSADAFTLGCESGAIVTCMDWGYTPWDPATGAADERRRYVFGSCLQAKRAAYFVGKGDLASYTRNGTRIYKRDQYGFGVRGGSRAEELPHLEAIWSPQGAVCLNPDNRRLRRSVTLPGTAVPPCGSPPRWSLEGKLATSPVQLEP